MSDNGVLTQFRNRVGTAPEQDRGMFLYGVVDEVCPALGGYFICFKPYPYMQADAAFLSYEVAVSCHVHPVKAGDEIVYSAVAREGDFGHYREIDRCKPQYSVQILPFMRR